jgi:hypothetical protein
VSLISAPDQLSVDPQIQGWDLQQECCWKLDSLSEGQLGSTSRQVLHGTTQGRGTAFQHNLRLESRWAPVMPAVITLIGHSLFAGDRLHHYTYEILSVSQLHSSISRDQLGLSLPTALNDRSRN